MSCSSVQLAFGRVAYAKPPSDEWKIILNKNGIVVDQRKVQDSNLHEFRGRGLIDTPMMQLLAVLADASRRTEWMHDCVGSWLIEKIDDRTDVAYNRTHAPWPVSDRDAVLQGRTTVRLESREVRNYFYAVEHPKGPPVRGVVRMPFLRGHWYFRAVNGGRSTCVEYQIHANPGGLIPGWLANQTSKQLPFLTLEGLRRQVQRRQYPEFTKALESVPEFHALLEALNADAAARAPQKPASDICTFEP